MKKELKNKNTRFGKALYDLTKKYSLKLSDQSSIENILFDALVPFLEKTMNAEMDEHLGYNKQQKTNFENSRNRYFYKNIWNLFGEKRIKASLTDIVLLNY